MKMLNKSFIACTMSIKVWILMISLSACSPVNMRILNNSSIPFFSFTKLSRRGFVHSIYLNDMPAVESKVFCCSELSRCWFRHRKLFTAMTSRRHFNCFIPRVITILGFAVELSESRSLSMLLVVEVKAKLCCWRPLFLLLRSRFHWYGSVTIYFAFLFKTSSLSSFIISNVAVRLFIYIKRLFFS